MAAQADPMNAATGTSKTADAAGRSNLEPRLCYDDLRQWLEEARKLGEVKDVSGLTWQQDIGMVAGMVHDDSAPCFVFDAVPGTIKGSRVLVNFFGGKRKNMTLGFPTDLGKIELSEGFRTNFLGPMTRIAPKYVDDGPKKLVRNPSLSSILDRKSTRLNSSHLGISYAVFCLKKKI